MGIRVSESQEVAVSNTTDPSVPATGTTNTLDALVGQVADEAVRNRLSREIELLRGSRRFGLVFDRHIPESVQLVGHPIRVGTKVALRDESRPGRTWRVVGFAEADRAQALLDGDGGEVPVERLVVVREFGEPVYPGLRSVERVERAGEVAPWHVVINGENFHVLQALRETHREKVDLIYIDPPYNTGGRASWLYNDRFVDGSDRAKSSKWLSFMERRLTIARQLLRPTGAVFVSIGDDEHHRLRMLMDQVFGVDNFVVSLTVEMSTTSGPKTTNAQQGTIVKNSEFVLIYRKSDQFDRVAHTPLYDGVQSYDTHYGSWLDDDGTLRTLGEVLLGSPEVGPDIQRFGLATARGFSLARMDELLTVSSAAREFIGANLHRIARVDRPPVSAAEQKPDVGRWSLFEAPDRTYFLTTLASGTLQQLMPLSLNYRDSDDYKPRFGRTVIRGDLWRGFHQDMGNVGTEGGVGFDNGKKPVRLIKQLIRWANNAPDAVVLDFFGGSGTTTHAVMAMNAEDGGARRSILVTNNEVGRAVAGALRKAGHHPGDPDWESEGVFNKVTRNRLRTVATGIRPDGSPYAGALAANVEFFDLAYLDPGSVRRGREFDAVAPLLWLQAGATGVRIDAEPEDGWALTPAYGVLFDVDALASFADAVSEAAMDECAPRVVFVVTDSPTEFQHAVERLPTGVATVRLYDDYLASCTTAEDNGR